ncbi:YciI family protein [Thalassoroseus pseudoceratinae]|uniref:YciI family protein n=1 Tax=Thalassoroseus pseudoceratinae TaxID=2713176 RepID=UPI001422F0FF|nr:YciI family protein [Thalassoroseus pseudoceratinae]
MRVMVIVKASPSSEAGEMPSEQLLTEMGQFNEELVEAGIMQAGDGLKPSSEGVRVHFSGSGRTVHDGPFAETKELIAGYWLWEVESMQEAIDWAKRCPNPMMEDSDIEIRPLFESADFGEELTPELREQENQLQTDIAMRAATVQTYLFFNGRCEEALEFYKTAVGAKIGMVMRFNESPEPMPQDMIPPGFEDKVMHCAFTIGQTTVMASDHPADVPQFGAFRLALTVPSRADADRVFDALAKGGKVDMPLSETFWSPHYGMLTDKFGIGWMVMVCGENSC